MARRRMKMTEILKLESCDFGVSVGDAMRFVYVEDHFYYDRIKAQMAKDGINAVPILVRYDKYSDMDELGNGHHRVKMALDLGLDEMIVTDDPNDCGWDEPYGSIRHSRDDQVEFIKRPEW